MNPLFQITARPYIYEEHVIKRGRCCYVGPYMSCYTTSVTRAAEDTGAHACHGEGFLMTQVIWSRCDMQMKMCQEEIRCCLPA